MSHHDDRGMVTAEYTVGTLGVVMIAVVLYKFGLLDNNNPWIESLKEILERALGWGTIKSILPGFGMRLR